MLEELLEHRTPAVIASGGGVVLRGREPRAPQHRRRHRRVARPLAPAFLASRWRAAAHRPLLAGDESAREVLDRLHEERTSLYEEVADITVDVEPFHDDAREAEAGAGRA